MYYLAALLILVNLMMPGIPFGATHQESVEVEDLGATYRFGEEITFRARIDTDAEIEDVILFITPEGQPTVWEEASLNDDNEILQSVDVRQLTLASFSNVAYYYQVTLTDGTAVNSPTYQFFYNDNRFDWKSLKDDTFHVFWYERDAAFGQEVLNVAQKGLDAAQDILDQPAPAPLRIYVYATSKELQSALHVNNQPWIAGHASPDLSLILISVPSGPEQKLELERQLPHEIMHILQYQIVGNDFRRQPVWLMEGMASIGELYPNPEYNRVLTATAEEDHLLPISSLCTSFPREASGAYLAYAQSESFVRFLYQEYGATGLRRLMSQYQNGLGCEEGVAAAFDDSLGQLEYRWKQKTLGLDSGGLALSNLTPYFMLLLLVLAPAAIALYPYSSLRKEQDEVKP